MTHDLARLRARLAAEVETHGRAWREHVAAVAALHKARASGARVPYRVAQRVIDASAAVGRSQDRLNALDADIASAMGAPAYRRAA